MNSFAFIVNPISLSQLKDYWPMIKLVPDFIIRSSLKNIPPFKVAHISKIQSIQGKEIEGYVILCPLLPELIIRLEESFILDKLMAAAHIAEGLNAKIIGLNSTHYPLTEKAFRKIRLPLTNGDTLSAWSAFEALYRMSRVKKINLKQATALVINAGSAVGTLCAEKISEYTGKIILCDKNKERLIRLKESILHIQALSIEIAEDANNVAKDADIIINTGNSPEVQFNIKGVKPGAIICDVSLYKNLIATKKENPEKVILEAGLIKLPFPTDLGFDTGLAKGIVPAALAETMLLTFKEKFASYSLGDNINPDNLEEIADIAAFCGFEVWVPEAPVL